MIRVPHGRANMATMEPGSADDRTTDLLWIAPPPTASDPQISPSPSPGGVTTVEREQDEDRSTEDGPVAHIVRTAPGEDAAAKILEARINGTPVEALCGHVWVPSRDPARLPVCEKCVEIYRMYREFNDGLDETPRT